MSSGSFPRKLPGVAATIQDFYANLEERILDMEKKLGHNTPTRGGDEGGKERLCKVRILPNTVPTYPVVLWDEEGSADQAVTSDLGWVRRALVDWGTGKRVYQKPAVPHSGYWGVTFAKYLEPAEPEENEFGVVSP